MEWKVTIEDCRTQKESKPSIQVRFTAEKIGLHFEESFQSSTEEVKKLFSGLTDHLALMDYIKKNVDLPETQGASVVNLYVRAVS